MIGHARGLEQHFVADGWGLERHPFAADGFVLLDPSNDPAGARQSADPLAALRRIADSDARFLSRGDRSGTHIKEQELWRAAGIHPDGTSWYRTAEAGMAGSAATARDAVERGAYTLVDRATYLTARPSLEVVAEGDPPLLNVLSILPVNPSRAAETFVRWLLGDDAQALMGEFGRAEHGVALFLRRDQIPASET